MAALYSISSGAVMAYVPHIRLFVEAPLAGGASVALSEAQGHYLTHVMRAGAGAHVLAFNGQDGEWEAEVAIPGKRRVALNMLAQTRVQDAVPDVELVFAPVKRIEFLVEKATELGARALRPVFTRRTTIGRVNLQRLRAHTIEAAEQSDRLSVPDLAEAVPLMEALAQWPAGRRLYFLDETGGGVPIKDAFEGSGPLSFLTGPEGGFEQTELDALRQLPFAKAVGLGPRVLRAETAALAALACWQALQGDWHGR
ncbi:MAG: 16S rRNA (uracil(1498)-N(3))-methyltransferase [Hyphomicrobium sp.]